MTVNYKDTVFLPKTSFSMRGNLPEKEPEMVAHWESLNLYQRRHRKGAPKFTLHDGPPYANGHLHLGHALNKILKDVVMKAQYLLGHDVPYVPGWDCHGLPIEWKIEEKYRAEGKSKDEVPINEFRKQCRDFAAQWIDVQREEFKRLGILGDWDKPYVTMDFKAEAQIVRELHKFLINGGLYKGFKPVMWSVVEKTALAEAEVEYQDKTSPSVYVGFPIVKSPLPDLQGARAVIWTTTPWTIPANRAIAYGNDLVYTLVQVETESEKASALKGDKFLIAQDLIEAFSAETGLQLTVLNQYKGSELKGIMCHHPFHGQGYDFDVPFVAGHHVTTESGTGLVHTAPSHGPDDFQIGREYGLEVPETLDEGGVFYPHVPLFAGLHVFKADKPVMEALLNVGALVSSSNLVHSYPHSWRSKAPLIFRATPQWFIGMEINNLRETCLNAIQEARWIPEIGEKRITSMIQDRPDWCISRQRAWGVPLALFVEKSTGKPLQNPIILERVAKAIEEKGADVWFDGDPCRFLVPEYKAEDFEAVKDILDVWFDSGSTHAYVLEEREELESPADLYLEGSDQHRGWFQSSLIESCGTRGRAPYKTVLTHGFVLDERGRKMSKSLGNTILPQDVMKKMGAEILRLWVINSDYSEDIRIGQQTLTHQQDIYRRLRNTLRYLLGALDGFSNDEIMDSAEMPELERWVLHRLSQMNDRFLTATQEYNFQKFYAELHTFCAIDLSAYYFDIRKDTLYCDALTNPTRRAARTVFHYVFETLVRLLSPVLSFTAEEAWLARYSDSDTSVHLQTLFEIPDSWKNEALDQRFEEIRKYRRVMTAALEVKRAENKIGSSLQANLVIYDLTGQLPKDVDWAEQSITSGIHILPEELPADAFMVPEIKGLGVVVETATGEKCSRCWKVLEEVGTHDVHQELCLRCADAVEEHVHSHPE